MQTGILIHPKYNKLYKITPNSDYNKLLLTTLTEEFDLGNGIKMIIPKIYNDNHGFALDCFKYKLLFSKAIFIGNNEEELRALLMQIYWLGHNPELKHKETKRIAMFQ